MNAKTAKRLRRKAKEDVGGEVMQQAGVSVKKHYKSLKKILKQTRGQV